MNRLILLFLMFLCGLKVNAFKPDSLFIKPYNTLFTVKLFTGIRDISFNIRDEIRDNSEKNRLTFKPNVGMTGGVGFSVRNLMLSFSSSLPGTERDITRYGETHATNYQLNLTMRFIHLSMFHRRYSGFFLSNFEKNYPDQFSPVLKMRPDITYNTLGAELIYSLNPRRYSLNASFKMTEKQVRNVWAGLIYANIASISIDGDSSFVPSVISSYFPNSNQLFRGNYFGWSIQPGITYCFVRRNWHVNPMVFSGVGYANKKVHYFEDGVEEYNDFFFRFSAKIFVGYSFKKFFTGLSFDLNNAFIPEKKLMIRTGNMNLIYSVGFRF